MSNTVFGMLLLSVLTGWCVVWDIDDDGPGLGVFLLSVETFIAAIWAVTLVAKGMGFFS